MIDKIILDLKEANKTKWPTPEQKKVRRKICNVIKLMFMHQLSFTTPIEITRSHARSIARRLLVPCKSFCADDLMKCKTPLQLIYTIESKHPAFKYSYNYNPKFCKSTSVINKPII